MIKKLLTALSFSKVHELSYEQKREIDRLGNKAYRDSSNSNKYRFELYAYIEGLLN